MSGPLGTAVPLFLSTVAVPLGEGPLHFGTLQAGLALGGLLGMGLRGFIGGGDKDEEAPSEISADEDFLDAGEFGGGEPDDEPGFDGLDEDEDDQLEEIEPRIDDLEHELEELASTISAVRGENQAMQESVEDIESNVRQLLEIYEVVTRGANPFVDEADEAPRGGGSFGLLEAGETTAAAPTEVTETTSVDDLFADAEPVGDESAAADPDDRTENESVGAAASGASAADGNDPRGEGLSFDELKSEFEFRDDEPDASESEPPATNSAPAQGQRSRRIDEPRGAKPYLQTLPGGYGAELLTMEWLTYLVSESSLADAIRAIRYYRTVKWIAEDVAAELQEILTGMTPERQWAAPDGGLPSELTVDHHTQSLEYIAELDALTSGDRRLRGPEPRGRTHHRGEDHGVQR